MIYDNLEFHNVQQLEQSDQGLLMCRAPAQVRSRLSPGTADRYLSAANVEIRFRAETLPVEIYLTTYNGPVSAAIYLGDYFYGFQTLTEGESTIRIETLPMLERYSVCGRRGIFDPGVIRVLLHCMNARICYRGCSSPGALTPPRPEDLPRRRYLAYGTSITHGARAISPELTYCSQAAVRMQADLWNMGVSGAAVLEPELGAYLAEDFDFDIFTAEISVNMLNQGYTVDSFYRRTADFLGSIARRHPQALKAVISILPCFLDLGCAYEQRHKATTEDYRKAARAAAGELGFVFLEGPELLDPRGLSFDMIHPGNLGMIQLGENLARRLMDCRPSLFEKNISERKDAL